MKRVKAETITDTPEDTQMVTHQDNPLLIDVVVEHLFKIIPFNCDEYKNLRQVSKLFWKSSLPTWRRNMWISVNGRIYRSNNSCPYIECYVDMLGAAGDPYLLLGKFGFQKYKLEDWEFKFGAGGRINRKKLEFWSKVGVKMSHFKCSNSVFHTREDFQRVIFEFMPNLQFLSLERNVYKCGEGQPTLPRTPVFYKGFVGCKEDLMPSSQEIQGNVSHVEISLGLTSNCKLRNLEAFPVWWSHFFVRFPNIKVLKLQNLKPSFPLCSNLELERLLDCVEMLRAKCGPHILAQLEELDILSVSLRATERLSHKSISHLRNFSFPLKSLAIEMGFGDPMGYELFRIILETHCNILQKLTVYRAVDDDPPPLVFPAGVYLPHLTELRLIGNVFDSHLFLKATPNLWALILIEENAKQSHAGALGILKNEHGFSLRYLDQKGRSRDRFPAYTPMDKINAAALAQEGIVCSKLEVFILAANGYILDENKFAGMAKVMPNLKKLGKGLAFSEFTAVCENWKDLEALHIDEFWAKEKVVLGIQDGVKYRLPNITNLTRLKYFGTGLEYGNQALSNDLVLHGLLALPNLEDVAVKLAPEVTEDVRLMLPSKFPHSKIQLYCNDNEDSDDFSSECDVDTD